MKRPRHPNCVICGSLMKGEHGPQGWYVNTAYCSGACNGIANKIKDAVHRMTAAAKVLGLLPPAAGQRCVDCGVPAKFYDHRDYSKPLVVEPVCHRCNILRGPGKYPEALAA